MPERQEEEEKELQIDWQLKQSFWLLSILHCTNRRQTDDTNTRRIYVGGALIRSFVCLAARHEKSESSSINHKKRISESKNFLSFLPTNKKKKREICLFYFLFHSVCGAFNRIKRSRRRSCVRRLNIKLLFTYQGLRLLKEFSSSSSFEVSQINRLEYESASSKMHPLTYVPDPMFKVVTCTLPPQSNIQKKDTHWFFFS